MKIIWKQLPKYQLKIKYNIEEKQTDVKYDIDDFLPCASLDLENDEGIKLESKFSSCPVLFPKIPLNLKKIKPAIMAKSIISMYSKL